MNPNDVDLLLFIARTILAFGLFLYWLNCSGGVKNLADRMAVTLVVVLICFASQFAKMSLSEAGLQWTDISSLDPDRIIEITVSSTYKAMIVAAAICAAILTFIPLFPRLNTRERSS